MQIVTSKDGTSIAFDRSGQGPALILVGGAMSRREDAAPLAAPLAPEFTVFAYDRRGRGDSGDTLPYAVEREIDDIAALIAEAGGSAFIFGHSSGAVLAIRAAATGLTVPKLAIYEAPLIIDASRPPLPRDYVAHLNELVAAGRRGDAVEYFMTAAVMVPDGVVTQMRASPMWPGMESVAHTIAYDGMVMGDSMWGDPTTLNQWTTLAVPTLVLDGGASEPWMRYSTRTLAETLPRAQYRTLEGQNHSADPEMLAPVLINFFKGE